MILAEYLETVFVATVDAGPWDGSFAIVTACNPGEMLGASENRSRADQLQRCLKGDERVRRFCNIEGCSPDLGHREASLAVWGLSLEQALELGRLWKQNAIFWVDEDQLTVVGCRSGREVALGNFLERLRIDGAGGGA